MARVFRRQGGSIINLLALLGTLSFAILCIASAGAQGLYEQPMLVLDPDIHTTAIRSAVYDEAGQFAVTGSEDKTVRIWSGLCENARVAGLAQIDFAGRLRLVC